MLAHVGDIAVHNMPPRESLVGLRSQDRVVYAPSSNDLNVGRLSIQPLSISAGRPMGLVLTWNSSASNAKER